MPWTRLDDGFHHHPKILALSDAAHRLFVDTLNWAVGNLTDGHVPTHLPNICLPHGTDRTRKAAIAELVGCGLWTQNGTGWLIHDFSDYQETKEEVRARREKWSNRKRSTRESTVESTVDTISETPKHSRVDPVRTRVPIPKPKETSLRSVSADDEHSINRNGVWTALEDLFGVPASSDRTLRGKVVKSLAGVGATYSEVKARAAVWPNLFSKDGKPLTLTPTALEAHWGQLGKLLEVETKAEVPCSVCDSRRIVGFTKEGEVVKVDDPRAVVNDRCVCVAK